MRPNALNGLHSLCASECIERPPQSVSFISLDSLLIFPLLHATMSLCVPSPPHVLNPPSVVGESPWCRSSGQPISSPLSQCGSSHGARGSWRDDRRSSKLRWSMPVRMSLVKSVSSRACATATLRQWESRAGSRQLHAPGQQ